MAVPDTGMSQRLVNWARIKSPWITVYNSGGCNACDIEIIACLMPRFDVERFGILVKGSPRHADILIVTGIPTLKQASRLRRVWEQIPEPKYVIALGACGASGGVFGILLAYAMFFPNRIIVLLIPPIPMPAWLFVMLYAGIELTLGVTGTQAGVAHFAHLGGMIGGYIVIRRWRRRRWH